MNLPDERNPLRDGLLSRRPPDPATLVLFGASGDLTRRKLLPALYHLSLEGFLPNKLAIVGVARRAKTDAGFRAETAEALGGARADGGSELLDAFLSRLFYHAASFDDPGGYRTLRERLDAIGQELALPPNRLFYLSTGPEHFLTIVNGLDGAGLVRKAAGREGEAAGWSRVVVEKPFGRDLESARALNRELLKALDERQLFRIDHYLGKETVQNLLALRFSNGIFEPLWNQKYVDHVQITVAETLGVEGRGGYYDGAGALRDMVQNHLMQVLALVAMEPPGALEAESIRDEKVKVLRAVRGIDPAAVERSVVRGQYARGAVGGREVPGYREEDGVPAESATETFVALRLEVENWRWAGTPFFLRSGKRLPKRVSEVCIQFRRPPLHLFGQALACDVAANALIVNIQPDEGISLRFGAKAPGPDVRIRQVKMDFRYGSSFGVPTADAYERLLLDALSGDSTLFLRGDEVENAWRVVAGAHEGWASQRTGPHPYAAGTWGPAAADALFEGRPGCWRRL